MNKYEQHITNQITEIKKHFTPEFIKLVKQILIDNNFQEFVYAMWMYSFYDKQWGLIDWMFDRTKIFEWNIIKNTNFSDSNYSDLIDLIQSLESHNIYLLPMCINFNWDITYDW